MKSSSPNSIAGYEQMAAEFLAGRAEAAGDFCETVFQRADAQLADGLIAAAARRLGKIDFARLVEAFGRLRSE